MAADLHIHIRTPEVTEEVLNIFFANTLGHSRCCLGYKQDKWSDACLVVAETPNVHVGEVSWLKASLLDDPDEFVPATVMAVSEVIGEETLIDDNLISKIKEAYDKPNSTSYSLTPVDKVVEFLEMHKGERCFTISW